MVLEGTWFVLATNFPMWTKGRRMQPRFVYSHFRGVEGRETFDSTVEYVEGGRARTIVGVETCVGLGRYRWRGTGWLGLFTSRWQIIAATRDEQLLAISFEATLFTPAGIDLISRTKHPDEDAVARLVSTMGSPPLTRLAW